MFYGPAGAGKTTILLSIAGNTCRQYTCIYVSTEETLHYERVARDPDRFGNVLFIEVFDMDNLLKTSYFIYLMKPRYVFIDSINSIYRVEVFNEITVTKQTYITSLLLEAINLSNGKLFASAQVRSGERGEIEASGFKILDYYFDTIIGILIHSEGYRYLKIEKTPIQISGLRELLFKITENGVEWLDRR